VRYRTALHPESPSFKWERKDNMLSDNYPKYFLKIYKI